MLAIIKQSLMFFKVPEAPKKIIPEEKAPKVVPQAPTPKGIKRRPTPSTSDFTDIYILFVLDLGYITFAIF